MVLAERRLPFDGHDAQDLARDLLHADGLADRIGRTKQIGDHGLAEHTDLPGGRHVVVCEEGPPRQAPAPDGHIRWGDPAHLGRPILVTGHDLDAHIDIGRHLCQERDLRLERVRVPDGQTLRPMRARPHPIDIAIAGLNPDEILAQAADLFLDVLRRALPDRHTTDKGPDTNTDAEHTEHRAERVTPQGAQGDTEDQREGHRRPRPRVGLSLAAGPTTGSGF